MYLSSIKKRNLSLPVRIALPLLALTVLFLLVVFRFYVTAKPFIESAVTAKTTDLLNESVSEYLKKYPDAFTKIISVSNEPSEKISRISVDTLKINQIKSGLTETVNRKLSENNRLEVSVPVSALLGLSFLNGGSANIHFTIYPTARTVLNIFDSFSGGGINQTRLSFTLSADTEVTAVIPGIRTALNVSVKIPLGDTVFIGSVPNYYVSK